MLTLRQQGGQPWPLQRDNIQLKTDVGASHLNSQKKNAADRGNGPCIGPKGENLR